MKGLLNAPPSFFYAAFRVLLLFLILVLTVLWPITGFDSTIFSIFDPSQYGLGTHISTVLNTVIITYLIMVNVGMGGLSLRGFGREVKRDFILLYVSLFKSRVHKRELLFMYREAPFHPVYFFLTSIFSAVFAFYVFEVMWAYLYNLGGYGDLVWPIYYWKGAFSLLLWRNYGIVAVSLFMVLLYPRIFCKVKVKPRLTLTWVWTCLIALSIISMTLWYYYPFDHKIYTYEDALNNGFSTVPIPSIEEAVMPGQRFFPQTIYGVYEEKYLNAPYPTGAYGFYAPDDGIHLLNILAKIFITASCAYPLIYAKVT